MKIQAFLKIAVVATAALAAYAFSGSANSQQMFTRSDTCQNIIANCSNQNEGPICMIKVAENKPLVKVYDLLCKNEIRHTNSSPVLWTPENP